MLVDDKEKSIDQVGYHEELYKETHNWRPRLDWLELASVSREDNLMLERWVREVEVWQTIRILREKGEHIQGWVFKALPYREGEHGKNYIFMQFFWFSCLKTRRWHQCFNQIPPIEHTHT